MGEGREIRWQGTQLREWEAHVGRMERGLLRGQGTTEGMRGRIGERVT